MTLPASGIISYLNVLNETGNGAANIGMNWIADNTRSDQRAYHMANMYSKAYYQKNVDGNCNNGNCTSNCNCGGQTQNCNCRCAAQCGGECNCNCSLFHCSAVNCANCLACTGVNCANCDARPWLQVHCNCACSYNCNITSGVTVNCSAINCNCNCSIVNCVCSTDSG